MTRSSAQAPEVKYSYKVHYRYGRTGMVGFMVLPSAALAAGEKFRLEQLGYTVTAIVPPDSQPSLDASKS
jgi:hypothetical protein